jgi:hypothetical protein
MAMYDDEIPDPKTYVPDPNSDPVGNLVEWFKNELKSTTQEDIDKWFESKKTKWEAVTPDGKNFVWTDSYLAGDSEVVAKVKSTVKLQPLHLSHFFVLPADTKNPYSVKCALEMLYMNKGEIKYSGNEPNFEDVLPKLGRNDIE